MLVWAGAVSHMVMNLRKSEEGGFLKSSSSVVGMGVRNLVNEFGSDSMIFEAQGFDRVQHYSILQIRPCF